MTKNITITGGNSYLGSYIANYLLENSDFNLHIIHSPRANEKNFTINERITNTKADLSREFNSELKENLKKTDKVFHFAWLRGKNEDTVFEKNLKMLSQLLQNIEKPEKLFFISSVSGTPNTKSEYGKNKYKALQFLEEKGANVIILGLVMEENPEKGPYKMLQKIAEKLPISFRISKHEPLVFPIKKELFAERLLKIAQTNKETNKYGVFEKPLGFNQFMNEIEDKFQRKRIKLSFNARFLLKIASFAKKSKLVPVKICDQILTFFYKDSDYLLTIN